MQGTVVRIVAHRLGVALFAVVVTLSSVGCSSPGTTPQSTRLRPPGQPLIRRIVCMYDQRPWLNLDRQGDLGVEGFWFRIFLDPGTGRGTWAEGTMHIELYRIDRSSPGSPEERTLVSDWHYPSMDIPRIAKPGMLGNGYVPQLVWADKALSGMNVDVVVSFEDADGNIARAGTKRLSIPGYGK